MTLPSSYLMDDPREAHRLATKVDAVNWVQRYVPSLPTSAYVLDVGCGPGSLLHAIGQHESIGMLVGLDLSIERLRVARDRLASNPLATLLQANANALPFADNSFDFAYTRFLLEYLCTRDVAVRELFRVLRPGGTALIQDLDCQFFHVWPPYDEPLHTSVAQVIDAMCQEGFDPNVGRQLHHLAHSAGFQDITVDIEPYHNIAGAITPRELQLWELKLDIAKPLIGRALGGSALADRFVASIREYLLRDDTSYYSLVFTVRAQRPRRVDSEEVRYGGPGR